jgi:hypothetical protein
VPSLRLSRFITYLALLVVMGSGCATLQQFAALGNVHFSLDRVSGLCLAGIELVPVRKRWFRAVCSPERGEARASEGPCPTRRGQFTRPEETGILI